MSTGVDNVEDMTARRIKLFGGPASSADAAQHTAQLMSALALVNEAHTAAAAISETHRATIKDLRSTLKEEERQEDERFNAMRAECSALQDRLLAETAARARAEGELAGLRQAYADLKAMLEAEDRQPLVIPPASVSVTSGRAQGFKLAVIRDGGGQISGLKAIPEE